MTDEHVSAKKFPSQFADFAVFTPNQRDISFTDVSLFKDDLREFMNGLRKNNKLHNVLVDMSGVERISSQGVYVLLDTYKEAIGSGGEIVVADLTKQQRSLMGRMGCFQFFKEITSEPIGPVVRER